MILYHGTVLLVFTSIQYVYFSALNAVQMKALFLAEFKCNNES